ncbi:hypothetical protein ONZ45_g13185 [Pleurotus djamor]|nr:hypothetical protein ONZ45_g13185 [Pleurotus djamor]
MSRNSSLKILHFAGTLVSPSLNPLNDTQGPDLQNKLNPPNRPSKLGASQRVSPFYRYLLRFKPLKSSFQWVNRNAPFYRSHKVHRPPPPR